MLGRKGTEKVFGVGTYWWSGKGGKYFENKNLFLSRRKKAEKKNKENIWRTHIFGQQRKRKTKKGKN